MIALVCWYWLSAGAWMSGLESWDACSLAWPGWYVQVADTIGSEVSVTPYDVAKLPGWDEDLGVAITNWSRLVGSGERGLAQALFVVAVASDVDLDERSAALEALGMSLKYQRKFVPLVLAAIDACLRHEEEQIRHAAIATAGDLDEKTRAAYIPHMEWLMTNDPHADVRAAAQAFVLIYGVR